MEVRFLRDTLWSSGTKKYCGAATQKRVPQQACLTCKT